MFELEPLDVDILEFFYLRWWENNILYVDLDCDLDEFSKHTSNEVEKSLARLEHILLDKNYGQYRITTFGILNVEKNNSQYDNEIIKREEILVFLKKMYDEDIHKKLASVEFYEKLDFKFDDKMKVLAILKFFENQGLIKLDMALGGSFWISLDSAGEYYLKNRT